MWTGRSGRVGSCRPSARGRHGRGGKGCRDWSSETHLHLYHIRRSELKGDRSPSVLGQWKAGSVPDKRSSLVNHPETVVTDVVGVGSPVVTDPDR